MTEKLKQEFIYETPMGAPLIYGPNAAAKRIEKQIASTIEVTIDFHPNVPPDVRERPRVKAQLTFITEAIRGFMQTEEYRNGLRAAVLSAGLDGKVQPFNDGSPIISYAALHESFMRLRFGRIAPVRGFISPRDWLYIYQNYYSQHHVLRNPLDFEGAELYYDFNIPDGHVRWHYGKLV